MPTGVIYEKVKKLKEQFLLYHVDETVKRHGHLVVCLPPCHYKLNPTKMVHAKITGHVALRKTTFRIADVEDLVKDVIHFVTLKCGLSSVVIR